MKFFRTWSASHISVSTGVFQRLLVLFKGFLLRLWKSFFCLSAWRSSIIPHPGAVVNTFWHLFSNFFAVGVWGQNSNRNEPSQASLRDASSPEGGAFGMTGRSLIALETLVPGQRRAPSQSSPVGLDSSPKGRAKSTAGNFLIMPNTLVINLRPWLPLRGSWRGSA